MRPEDFRRFLAAMSCAHRRTRRDGTEVWERTGVNAPIVFFGRGDLTDDELRRLMETMGVALNDLSTWRARHKC